jgi:hypothetical protein
MTEIVLAEVIAELENGLRTATIVDADSSSLSLVPAQWRKIALSGDAEERRLLALSLWNRDFLDLIPGYAEALRTRLRDVRVCVFSDEGPILIYLLEVHDGSIAVWIGWDPATFGDKEPIFWDTIPAPAQTFLREVHAGFTGPDWEGLGIVRPKSMTTYAEWFGSPDGIPGWFDNWWDDCEPVDSRRMLYITHAVSIMDLSTSPDLASGRAITWYEGHLQIGDFGKELDLMMLSRVE